MNKRAGQTTGKLDVLNNKLPSRQSWEHQEDAILVKAHLKGDKTAFEVLFKKYQEMVARLVFSIVKEESHVEDIVQDTFILVFRNLASFKGAAALKTWIYRIAVNEALRHVHRAKRWKPLPEEERKLSELPSMLLVFNPGSSPERVLVEAEQRELIQRALGTLKPDHRVILTLYYLEDLNVQELGCILSIPEGSIKSRLFYARQALRKALAPLLKAKAHGTDERMTCGVID